MKKMMALILTGIMILGCFGTAFAAETQVTVDGKPVVFTDAKPFVDENGRTMVPLRPVANAMGLNVEWDAESQTASFYRIYDPGMEGVVSYGKLIQMAVIFKIGSPDVEISGKVQLYPDGVEPIFDGYSMDTAPVVKDGRTYAPLRYLAQSFGYDVGWDNATKTVTVENNRMQ